MSGGAVVARERIGIALCTYNGARFLPAQLDSLSAQDYPDFTIVAVDDGSTDATVEILRAHARRDARLTVHQNPRNLGFAANFARALELSGTPLVSPCDQDDVWEKDKLSTLADALAGNVLVYCDSELIDERGSPVGVKLSDTVNMYSGSDPAAFLFSNCVSGHAMLFRRELLREALPFPEGSFHDWWLAFVAASLGRVQFVPRCLCHYRQHGAAQTDVWGKKDTARAAGARAKDARRMIRWLERRGGVPGPHQADLAELHAAFLEWQDHVVSTRLPRALWARRDTLFHINRSFERDKALLPFRYLLGLPARRRLSPARWAEPTGTPT